MLHPFATFDKQGADTPGQSHLIFKWPVERIYTAEF